MSTARASVHQQRPGLLQTPQQPPPPPRRRLLLPAQGKMRSPGCLAVGPTPREPPPHLTALTLHHTAPGSLSPPLPAVGCRRCREDGQRTQGTLGVVVAVSPSYLAAARLSMSTLRPCTRCLYFCPHKAFHALKSLPVMVSLSAGFEFVLSPCCSGGDLDAKQRRENICLLMR